MCIDTKTLLVNMAKQNKIETHRLQTTISDDTTVTVQTNNMGNFVSG